MLRSFLGTINIRVVTPPFVHQSSRNWSWMWPQDLKISTRQLDLKFKEIEPNHKSIVLRRLRVTVYLQHASNDTLNPKIDYSIWEENVLREDFNLLHVEKHLYGKWLKFIYKTTSIKLTKITENLHKSKIALKINFNATITSIEK